MFAVQLDAAPVSGHQADDDIEAGRLAGPVRTEQAHHLAAADGKRNVVDEGAVDLRPADESALHAKAEPATT